MTDYRTPVRQPRTENVPTGGSRFARLALAVCGFAAIAGCGSRTEPARPASDLSPAVEQLQRGDPQKALDALSGESSPRALWLKAIAFEKMNRIDDARAQIEAARQLEPDNVNFRGLSLRLDLYSAKMEAAEELLKLRDENRTSAPLALFSFYAYVARAVQQNSLSKSEEAKADSVKAMEALSSAIALSAEMPELQREMLSLAVKSQMTEGAMLLADKLYRIAPEDPDLISDRVTLMSTLGRYDEAVELAEKLYAPKKDRETALLIANLLPRSSRTEAHAQLFRRLRADHPGEAGILLQHSVFLALLQGPEAGIAELETALKLQTDPSKRRVLIDGMIGLALETGKVAIAEDLLNRYSKDVSDPLAVAYFKGRILMLKKDYAAALERFSFIVQQQKDAVGTDRALAMEAIRWTQRILADQEAARQLGETADAMRARAGLPPLNSQGPAEAEIP